MSLIRTVASTRRLSRSAPPGNSRRSCDVPEWSFAREPAPDATLAAQLRRACRLPPQLVALAVDLELHLQVPFVTRVLQRLSPTLWRGLANHLRPAAEPLSYVTDHGNGRTSRSGTMWDRRASHR